MGHYENKDFKLLESVAWFVDEGLLTYCPDGIDEVSWYNKAFIGPARNEPHLVRSISVNGIGALGPTQKRVLPGSYRQV